MKQSNFDHQGPKFHGDFDKENYQYRPQELDMRPLPYQDTITDSRVVFCIMVAFIHSTVALCVKGAPIFCRIIHQPEDGIYCVKWQLYFEPQI